MIILYNRAELDSRTSIGALLDGGEREGVRAATAWAVVAVVVLVLGWLVVAAGPEIHAMPDEVGTMTGFTDAR
jgi:hypothetical protein